MLLRIADTLACLHFTHKYDKFTDAWQGHRVIETLYESCVWSDILAYQGICMIYCQAYKKYSLNPDEIVQINRP